MAPVALYDSGFLKKSTFYPIAIDLQTLYNKSTELDLPAEAGRSFLSAQELLFPQPKALKFYLLRSR